MTTPPFEGPVFEDNLRRLLQRAYVPVLPSPEFRRGLTASFRSEFERQHGATPVAPVGPRRLPRLVAALALAAGLALVLRSLLGDAGPLLETPEERLARGEVVLRVDEGPWRAALGDERFDAGTLEVRTPAARAQTVTLDGGRVSVGVAGHLELTAGEEGLGGRLRAGHLELERSPVADEPWRLAAGPGELHLFGGAAQIEVAGDRARFVLKAGRAEVWSEGRGQELQPGRPWVLDPAARPTLPDIAGDPERVDLVPTPTETGAPEPPTDPAPAALPGLSGRLLPAPDASLPPRVELGLVRLDGGNRIEPAVQRELELEDGTFHWESPPAGPHRVYLHAPGHALATVTELELGDGVHALGDIPLSRGGRVSGEVIDARTGAPLPDVLVVSEKDLPAEGLPLKEADVYLWLPVSARTGSDGRFVLEHLSPGRHRLQFSRPDRAPTWIEALVDEGSSQTLDPVELEGGGSVEGTVTREDGSPWAGAQVLAARLDTSGRKRLNFVMEQTDSFGHFLFEALPTEQMMIVMIGDTDRPQVRPVEVRSKVTARVDFDGSRRGVRVRGRLLDAKGEPLTYQNMGFYLQSELEKGGEQWEATTTDGEGRFLFDALEAGLYAVMTVDRMGSRLALVSAVDVPQVMEHTVEIRLGDGILSGQVKSGLDGSGVRSVLHLESHRDGKQIFGGYTETDAEGNYTFSHLGPGTYVLTAYPRVGSLGFERGEPVRLDPVEPRSEMDFELFEGGAVETRVVDEDGQPIAYATILLVTPDGDQLSFSETPVTDDQGLFLARGVRPGTYTVLVRMDEREIRSEPLECRAGNTATVRLTWPTQSSPSGTDR